MNLYTANYHFTSFPEYDHGFVAIAGFIHGKYGRLPIEILKDRFLPILDGLDKYRDRSHKFMAKKHVELAYRDLHTQGDQQGANALLHVVRDFIPQWEVFPE